MTAKLDNALGLYKEGIRDGNARAALDKYLGDRYTQHSTGVADGKEGFLAFFEPFLVRNPVRDIEVVRAIEDGSYVFCHAAQTLGGTTKWVTTDLFDTDAEDRIVEHWDTIAPGGTRSPSGHTQTDGATKVTDLERTAANKAYPAQLPDRRWTGCLPRTGKGRQDRELSEGAPPDRAGQLRGDLR